MSRILISPETGLIMIKLDWIGLFGLQENETQRAAQSLVPFEEIGGRP